MLTTALSKLFEKAEVLRAHRMLLEGLIRTSDIQEQKAGSKKI